VTTISRLRRVCLGTVICTALSAILPVSAQAAATTVSWATTVIDQNAGTGANILLKPNGVTTTLAPETYVWVRDFTDKHTYSGLATLLGVRASDLAHADLIAFDLNGGHSPPGGWESSTWYFTDEAHAYAETSDETILGGGGTITTGRRAHFKGGDMSTDAYGAFFGISLPAGQHVGWILITVPPDIDVHSPKFKVWVSGADIHGPDDEGTPDADAIGLITH